MRCKQLVIFLLPVVFGQYTREIDNSDVNDVRKGKYVDIENYPYVVSLRYAKSRKVICTGIIITWSWIMTVPYCFMLTPSHYNEERSENGTIPPLIEALAKKRNETIWSRFALDVKHENKPNEVGRHIFGPYNKKYVTHTTISSRTKDQKKTNTLVLEPSIFEVIAGTSFVSDCAYEGQLRNGQKIVIHPKFKQSRRKKKNARHELALLKVNIPFIKMSTVTTAPLFESFTPNQYSPTSCKLVGWGRGKTDKPLPHLQTSLSEINVRLYNSAFCRYIESTYHKSISHDDSEWFCSYDEDQHLIPVCQSDSGGPLVCNGKVAALLSWSRSPTCYYKATQLLQYHLIYYSRIYLDLKWLHEALIGSGALMSANTQEEDVLMGCTNILEPCFEMMSLLTIIYLIF